MVTDIIGEACIGVGAAICAFLAGFQAAQHRAYNSKTTGMIYQDVGASIALAVLLGLLM